MKRTHQAIQHKGKFSAKAMLDLADKTNAGTDKSAAAAKKAQVTRPYLSLLRLLSIPI